MKNQADLPQSDEEWQAHLSAKNAEPNALQVTRHAATERPFSGRYNDHWENGKYRCVCCDALLFDSERKFDAGCGWSSFDQAQNQEAIAEKIDDQLSVRRTETICATCGAHLGHVFPDGPTETGLRYCMNSAALRFVSND